MSTLALVPPAPITPTRLREVVAMLHACVQADRARHHQEVSIWLGGLIDRVRMSEEQDLCGHATVVQEHRSGSEFRVCAICRKELGRIK